MSLRSKIRRLSIAAGATTAAGLLAVSLAGAASASTARPHLPPPPANSITLTYLGHVYVYPVNLHETPFGPWWLHEDVISGTLTDNYEPVSPLHLSVFGVEEHTGGGFGPVTFVISVSYPTTGPDAGNQGVRTFSGTAAGPFTPGSGLATETGTENLSVPFTIGHI